MGARRVKKATEIVCVLKLQFALTFLCQRGGSRLLKDPYLSEALDDEAKGVDESWKESGMVIFAISLCTVVYQVSIS